jgi:coenzyme F420-reducing hydrogenase delta subunit
MMNENPLKLCLFYCSNSLDGGVARQSTTHMGEDEWTAVSLPCSGKVDLLYLLKAFEKGADGVMLLTCPQGDCQFLEGNLRARKRCGAVAAILEEAGLGKEHIRVVEKKKDGGIQQIFEEMESLRQAIRNQRKETM